MTKTGFFDYSAYGLLILNLGGGLFGIGLGIYLASRGEKNRGWESPWSLIARDGFSVIVAVLIFSAFMESRLDGFWTSLLLGLVGLPAALYVVWNDHKHARLTATEGPFD